MANSTKPITSAKPSGARGLLAAVFAGVCAAIALFGGFKVWAGFRLLEARADLTFAESAPRGAGRDAALASAHNSAEAGLSLARHDPDLHLTMARVRWLQATTGAAAGVSDPLMQAAAQSAARAEALRPDGASAAMLSLAHAMLAPEQAAQHLSQSYQRAPRQSAFSPWRLEAASYVFTALGEASRTRALAEACVAARANRTGQDRVMAMALEAQDGEFAAQVKAILSDPTCAPSA